MNEELRAEIDKLRNEINSKFYELYEKVQNLQENEQPTGLWEPKEGRVYYYISNSGLSDYDYWYNESIDVDRYDIGNCFKTKEQAEQHLEHLKVEKQLRDIAERLNRGRKIDWGDDTCYEICLDPSTNRLYQLEVSVYSETTVCLDENFKDVAIQEIGEERLKEYLKEC